MTVTVIPVHLTKRALAYLLGLKGPEGPWTDGPTDFVCELPHHWEWPIDWVSVYAIDRWKAGLFIVLPNCPTCSVAWDEAISKLK